MARIAVGLTEDKNKKAAQKANEEFYAKHPKMKGKPIDPCDPVQAKYQKEWMDSYVKNGGAYRIGKYEATCSEPEVQTCPCDATIVVTVISDVTQQPEPDIDIEIWGPRDFHVKGRTDNEGKYTISGLEEERYLIQATKPDEKQQAEDDVLPRCRDDLKVTLRLGGTGILVVDVIDQFKEHVPDVTVYVDPGSGIADEKRTDKQGQAIFENIPTGNYQISAGILQRSGVEIHLQNSISASVPIGRTNVVLNVIATCKVPIVWVDYREEMSAALPDQHDQVGGSTVIHNIHLEQSAFVPIEQSLIEIEHVDLQPPRKLGEPIRDTSKYRHTARYGLTEGGDRIVSIGNALLRKLFGAKALPTPAVSVTTNRSGMCHVCKIIEGSGGILKYLLLDPLNISIGFHDQETGESWSENCGW